MACKTEKNKDDGLAATLQKNKWNALRCIYIRNPMYSAKRDGNDRKSGKDAGRRL